ncbi:MAG: type II toxin-antitoxin system VapC family toxin [Novosphingobium sp.]
MRLLLDTHIAVWTARGGGELSRRERELLDAPQAERLFSAVSMWELRLKWNSFPRSGARKCPASPDSVRDALVRLGCDELPLTAADAVAELHTPLAHNDPFDEILLIQAQQRGLRLLTRDGRLAEHPLAVGG